LWPIYSGLPVIKEGGLILLISLTQTYIYSVTRQDLDFQPHMLCPFFLFSKLKCEIIFRLVDIGIIVDHHCLDFLFIFVFSEQQRKLQLQLLNLLDGWWYIQYSSADIGLMWWWTTLQIKRRMVNMTWTKGKHFKLL
jgi:hypothetical protein